MKPVNHFTARCARLSLLGLLAGVQTARAAAADDFAFFQEEAKVVTASRREQPVSEVPMAVDVITAEEIRASGATNIADLLRFRVGMETYTYEHVSDWIGDQGSITQNTPAHKVNLGAIADLGHGFSGSMNVGYKDNYFITSVGRSLSAAIAAYWRLDARLAYALNVRTELFLACQNLAADTHVEFADGLTVPRTYQGGMTLKWGGGS